MKLSNEIPPNLLTLAVQPEEDPASTPQHVPPGRSRTDGVHLDSLEDVSPQRAPGETLMSALAAHAQAHPDDHDVQAAVALIAALDACDTLPPADAQVVQTAADLLLEEGQERLLCRLAEKKPAHVFALNIDNSPGKAGVLARIGSKWPSNVAVELSIASDLPAPALHGLHAFLQGHQKLEIQVVATFTLDNQALADVLSVSTSLKEVGQKITRLEVRAAHGTAEGRLACMPRVVSAEFMALLHVCGVAQLVVKGPVDLVGWVEEMDRYASSHPITRLLLSFEASFVVPIGADTDAALTSLERNGRIVEVVILPMVSAPEGFSPLDPAAESRMAVMNTFNTLAQHHLRAQSAKAKDAVAEVFRQARATAVKALANLLNEAVSCGQVVDYLRAPDSFLIQPCVASDFGDIFTQKVLVQKLWTLKSANLDAGLLRAAIIARLQALPLETEPLLKALIETQLLPAPSDTDAWRTLGLHFRKTWALQSTSPVERWLPGREPWPTGTAAWAARAVQLPAEDEARWALVEPSSQAGFEALGRLLELHMYELNKTAKENPSAPNFNQTHEHREALRVIRTFLEKGGLGSYHMTFSVCAYAAAFLQFRNQGRLLRHLVPAGASWQLSATDDAEAAALADVYPWPEPNSNCILRLSPALSNASLEVVSRFASSVPPDKLLLVVSLAEPVSGHWSDVLMKLMASNPGLGLGLSGHSAPSSPPDGWMAFLDRLQQAPIGRISLIRVQDGDGKLLPALLDTIRRVGVTSANLTACSEALTRGIASCHGWESLVVQTSRAEADGFMRAHTPILTKSLHLVMKGDDAQQCAEDMIGACKDLATLEVSGDAMNIAHLARGLKKAGSVASVTFEPAAVSSEDEQEAAELFRRNSSIIECIFKEPSARGVWQMSPISLNLLRLVQGVIEANQFRDSEWFRKGAGAGLAVSLSRPLPADVGSRIGNMLDVSAARALSLVNKAAYTGSQEVWRAEIETLADLLSSGVTIKHFVAAVNERVPLWNMRDGKWVAQPTTENTDAVVTKIQVLRTARVPDAVIGMALRCLLTRTLSEPHTVSSNSSSGDQTAAVHKRETLYALLQGLAYVGTMQPQTWLRKGLGIDLSNPPQTT
ncbi:hypothetical protein [Hydrogenophaga sp.]|uniref:hypothetical protein n=1 Tax=Hydrogenophaga sp. TaxID=1904254 RepID=UPI00271A544D|nr:hypothetical protein [Hydrogenophaga sp.]MDO9437194.1 hypothetical protein [Hydrogenophaga sp.]